VNYVRSCQQVKASRQNHQQLLLPIDIHLYSKIQYLLQNEGEAQLQAAIKLFRDTMERYKQQAKLAKQRLQHSGLTFDATLELPCAYHPQGANVVLESDSFVPYLEMEECHIDVNVRTTNRRQVQNQQYLDEDSDEDEDDEKANTFLNKWVGKFKNVVGDKKITKEDLGEVMVDFKQKLM